MTPARMRLIVGLAAVAAAAVVAGVVYATRQDPRQPTAQCTHMTPTIVPTVSSPHVQAVRAAFAKGPKRAALALETLAQQQPNDPVVQYNDGAALACAGYADDAVAAFRQAKKAGRDTYYRIAADILLHPQYFQGAGYPPFEYFGTDPLLLRGQQLQRQGRMESAERVWARAARLHPDDADAQVAAAVGRFDMDDLTASFSHLGPLVRRFPKSQSVRLHLGLLLVWTGQRDPALKELRLARALGPQTQLGREANRLLESVASAGTSTPKR